MGYCLPLDDPDNMWAFCPSAAVDIIAVIFFLIASGVHIFQMFKYRKWYSLVIIIAALWQTATYVFRGLSIYQPKSLGLYAIWFVLILVAPLWTNAFVYMVVGRMVYNFLPNMKLGKIKAWRFGMIFVVLDIFAFLVQVYGAARASGNNVPVSQIMGGLHIYMGGVGIQQIFIIIFVCLLIHFQRRIQRETPAADKARALRLLYVIYAVLLMITIRIIFRLIEYSSGLKSTIPKHEAYMYVLETLPMLIAIVLFNFVHPGAVMAGKESDIPGRKDRKRMFSKGTGYKEVQNEAELGLVTANYESGYGQGHPQGYPQGPQGYPHGYPQGDQMIRPSSH